MTLVAGRILQRRDTPKTFPRPLLKIPSPKLSATYEDPFDYLESRNNSFDIELLSPTLSNTAKATVAISTPSPSATADGYKVDFELAKFRRLSEEWIRNRETEEAENRVDILGSRSPSPQRVLGSPPKFYSQRNTSPLNQRPRSLSPDKTSLRRSSGQESATEVIRNFRSRSPSPLVYSSITKTFIRPGTDETVNKFNFQRSSTSKSDIKQSSSFGREKLDFGYRTSYGRETEDFLQSDSYKRDKFDYRQSPNNDKDIYEFKQRPNYGSDKLSLLSLRSPLLHKQIPISSIFRRSHSYESDDQIRSNFRSRSTSPNRLNPASSYYHRSNSVDERDYNSKSRSRSPSPQTSSHYPYYSLFKRSNSLEAETDASRLANLARLENVFKDSYGDKYNTLPRFRYLSKTASPIRENPFRTPDGKPIDYLKNLSKSFLVNSIPELPPPVRMQTQQRRYSEEPPSVRKPLATLHEDEDTVRRRYSDSIRRSPQNDGYRRSPFSDASRRSPFSESRKSPFSESRKSPFSESRKSPFSESRRSPFDSSDEDYYINRRLSEAGVRKCSDASVVLTEDTDSFIIGDRVWVGGIKPGSISYLGETQFAPGDWAGVTLDEPIGKNDGSVAGIRYFQCEPKKGVFSRLTRLSREALSDRDLEYLASKSSVPGSESSKSMSTSAPSITSASIQRKVTPSLHQQVPSSGSSVRKTTPPATEPVRKITQSSFGKSNAGTPVAAPVTYRKTSAPYQELSVGDRVTVDSTTGFKFGTLRHIGVTEFADGLWAGVELDEPTGKNDGSVAGKKYFTCRSKHGLFAPINRVSRYTGRAPISSRSSIPSIRRSRSRESLGTSSVGSASVSSIRAPGRPTRSSEYDSPSTRALQEALTEKSQHIDQLMRERDIERNEVSRMANQLEEAMRAAQSFKVQLSKNQFESEERLHDFEQKIVLLEGETKDLSAKLEDKQREIDDLNFRVEEESLAKADYQSQNTITSDRLKTLEEQLAADKLRIHDSNNKEASKAVEIEEIESSLNKSVEMLQAKVLELQLDKDNLCKKLDEEEEKFKKLEVANFSLSNSINEKEQKINLLEISQAAEEKKMKNGREELNTLEKNLQDLKLELEKKVKDLEDASQQAEEFLSDIGKEQQKRKKVEEELVEIQDKYKTIVTSESQLKLEVEKLKEKAIEFKLSVDNSNLKFTELDHEKDIISKQLAESEERNRQIASENSALMLGLLEKNEKITELEVTKSTIEENSLKDKINEVTQLQQNLLALKFDVEKKTNELEVESQRNKVLFTELEQEKLEKDKLSLELTDLLNQIRMFGESEAELKLEAMKCQDSVKEWKSMNEICNMKIAEIEREKDDLSRKLEEITEKYTICESENSSLKHSIKEKEESISNLEISKLAVEERAQKRDEDILHLEENLQVTKLELENKLCHLEEVSQQAAELELKFKSEVQEKRVIDDQLKELQDRVKLNIVSESHFNSEVIKLKDEAKNWKTAFENNETKMSSILKENGYLKKDLENSVVTVQSLNMQNMELKSSLTNFEKELAEMKALEEEKNQLINRQKLLEDKLDKLSEVEKINCILLDEKSKVENDLSNIRQSVDERNQIIVQNQKLKEELDALKNLEIEFSNLKIESRNLECKLERISELEQTVTRLNKEVEEAKNKNEILEKEKESILHTLDEKSDLEKENSEVNVKMQELEVEKSKSEQENLQLKHNLSILEETKSHLNQVNENLKLNMQSLQEEKSKFEEEEKLKFKNEVEQLQLGLQHLENEKLRLEELNAQLDQNIKNLEEKNGSAVKENELLNVRLKNMEEKNSDYEQGNEQFKLEVKSLQEAKMNLEKDIEQLKVNVKIFKERQASMERLNEQLTIEINNYGEEKSQLIKENKQFRLLIQGLEEGKTKFELLIEQLKLDVKNLEDGKLVLEQQVNNLSEDITRLKMTEVDYSRCLVELNCLRNEKEGLEHCINDLRDRVSNLGLIQKEKDNLDRVAKQLVESHKDIEERLSSQIRNLEGDKMASVREMEVIQVEIAQLKEGLTWGKEEIETKERQRAELQLELLRVESEKRKLGEEVKQLKESLILTEAGTESSDIAIKLKAERDQFEGQVSFLNSVIVDMQRKKEELESRISLLQTANVPDDEKANMNSRREKIKKAPRVFCDICDCFDLHDTEDCPTQSTSDSPPPSLFHGDRSASRPYCELCEVFGHEKGECPVDDTY